MAPETLAGSIARPDPDPDRINDPGNTDTTVDILRAFECTPNVSAAVDAMFTYQPWNERQQHAGDQVRAALAAAFKLVIEYVPPCPDRSSALRKLREARMDCCEAITHGGRR